MKLDKRLSVLASLGAMISVQGGASIAKLLFRQVGPAAATSLRIGIAGLLLSLLFRPKVWRFTRREWLTALFYGFSVGAMNLTFYCGIQRVPLGLGVTVEFIGPLGLALCTSRRPLDFLWAILAGLGIVLIVPWKGATTGVDPLGLLYVFIAGLMWAAYILAGSKLSRDQKMASTDAVSTGLCLGALFVIPFGIAGGDLWPLTPKILLYGLGVAVFSSCLNFSLDLLAMHNLPPKTFSILQSLHPAFAALSGLIFLHELLTPLQWLAMLCVIASSFGSTATARQEFGSPA